MSSDRFKKEMDRRQFLKTSMLGTTGLMLSSPINLFLSNVLSGMFQNSNALAAGTDPLSDKKMIQLYIDGGIARWYWDLPLQPNGNDAVAAAKMVVNRFRSGVSDANGGVNGIGAEFANVKVGDYYLPYLWNSLIATPTGSAPMANLAQNMLMMRGLNMLIDSHNLSRDRQVVPVSGGPSMTGLIADSASTPIPSIGNVDLSYFQYASKKGVSMVSVGNYDPLTQALKAFRSATSGPMRSLATSVGGSIDLALDVMKKNSGDRHAYLATTYNDRVNAKKMLSTQLGDLTMAYSALYNKYENLISRAFGDVTLRTAGIDDMTLPGSNTSGFWNIDVNEEVRYNGGDARSLTNTSTTVANLASSMAVTEFMLSQGYSSSFSMGTGSVLNGKVDSGLYYNNNNAFFSSNQAYLRFDSHFMGSFAGLLVSSRVYRAYASCLYELVNQMKRMSAGGSKSIFDQSVISIMSDFNRTPRPDGFGSDHGWNGTNYSILSGMIPQLTVVGDIKTQATDKYYGTFGEAATMAALSGQQGGAGNIASTVSHLLDIATPTPNSISYVSKGKDDKVASTIGRPKNV